MTPDITSLHNSHLKALARLRERKARRTTGQFLVEGLRECARAIAAGVEIAELLFDAGRSHDNELHTLLTAARQAGIRITSVASEPFEKLTYGQREEPVIAVAQQFDVSLTAARLPNQPLVLVVEGVEKPGNLGALLRTADAAGVAAVIAAGGGTDWFNPNTVRASLGALFTVPVFAAETEDVIAWLHAQRLALFATRVDATLEYTQVSYRGGCAIVLGSEADGLSAAWSGEQITPVYVPMHGQVDSLNVSVTAAILLYESLRQRAV